MSPPNLSVDKMSTGGHFKHITITLYHACATKALSCVCVCVFTDMAGWGNPGSTAAADSWISPRCISSCLFCIKWKIAKWKVMRKSTCWARSLPFSHIITEIDLPFRCSHTHAVSIERYCIWNACMPSLWNVYRAARAAAQLGNVLHFIKKISSPPLSGLETRLFINEAFFPSLIPPQAGMSGDKLKSQSPPGASGMQRARSTAAYRAIKQWKGEQIR